MRTIMLALGLAIYLPCGAVAQEGGHFAVPMLELKSSAPGGEDMPSLTLEGVTLETIDPGGAEQTYRLHVATVRPHCKLAGVGRARARLWVKLFYPDGTSGEQIIREFPSGSNAVLYNEDSTVSAIAAKAPIRVDYRFDGRCADR
jgi:hypothetical protein